MEAMTTAITCDIDFDRPGKQVSHLGLDHSDNAHAFGIIPIPIAVIAGWQRPDRAAQCRKPRRRIRGTGDPPAADPRDLAGLHQRPAYYPAGSQLPRRHGGHAGLALWTGSTSTAAFPVWRTARRPRPSPTTSTASSCPSAMRGSTCIPAAPPATTCPARFLCTHPDRALMARMSGPGGGVRRAHRLCGREHRLVDRLRPDRPSSRRGLHLDRAGRRRLAGSPGAANRARTACSASSAIWACWRAAGPRSPRPRGFSWPEVGPARPRDGHRLGRVRAILQPWAKR